jgi:hypothetical protein
VNVMRAELLERQEAPHGGPVQGAVPLLAS